GVRRAVWVGMRLQRRLHDDRNDDHAEQDQHCRHEFDGDQVRPDVHESLGLRSSGGRWLAFSDGGNLLAASGRGGGDFGGHSGAGRSFGNRCGCGRRYSGCCWRWGRGGDGRRRSGGGRLGAGGAGRLPDPSGGGALLVERGALFGLQALHIGGSLERSSHQSGPEMPPSLRIRQKWTAISTAVMSGMAMTWSTYQRTRVLSLISKPPISRKRVCSPTNGVAPAMFVPTVTAQIPSWSQGSR